MYQKIDFYICSTLIQIFFFNVEYLFDFDLPYRQNKISFFR